MNILFNDLSLSLRVSLLVGTLSDKELLLNTLQSLLEPDETPTHQSLSYPRKTSLDTLNERGGGRGGDNPVVPIRKTSSPVYPTLLMSLYHTRNHHYQLMINTCWE